MDQFWQDLLISFFTTLFGVILGMLGALWVDRRITSGRRRGEEVYILQVIGDNVNHNFKLLQQLTVELQTNLTPTYNVDLSAWKAHAGRFDAIRDIALVQKVHRLYFELEHLSWKIDTLRSMHFSTFTAISDYEQERRNLVTNTLSHMASLISQTGETLRLIKKSLG